MTYLLFGVRMAAHLWRFNSKRGPFGPSAFWTDPPPSVSSANADVRNDASVSRIEMLEHVLLEAPQEAELGI